MGRESRTARVECQLSSTQVLRPDPVIRRAQLTFVSTSPQFIAAISAHGSPPPAATQGAIEVGGAFSGATHGARTANSSMASEGQMH